MRVSQRPGRREERDCRAWPKMQLGRSGADRNGDRDDIFPMKGE